MWKAISIILILAIILYVTGETEFSFEQTPTGYSLDLDYSLEIRTGF